MTRKGPARPCAWCSWLRVATTCAVLPRPISSASITLRRDRHASSIQLTPSSWYGRSSLPFSNAGDASSRSMLFGRPVARPAGGGTHGVLRACSKAASASAWGGRLAVSSQLLCAMGNPAHLTRSSPSRSASTCSTRSSAGSRKAAAPATGSPSALASEGALFAAPAAHSPSAPAPPSAAVASPPAVLCGGGPSGGASRTYALTRTPIFGSERSSDPSASQLTCR
mmetsp:Transcript_24562/g.80081  ORF Transcript_24562/g.80081 Transcript_24562/m.80081 type:complete len:225 (-) Transcript_24562:1552-2226(-)